MFTGIIEELGSVHSIEERGENARIVISARVVTEGTNHGDSIAVNWRFRVADDVEIAFRDERCGEQRAIAGRDFGDFLAWRKDDTPSYQLATVVDEIDFGITEVVRGADLIKSTFRQLTLFDALGAPPPRFYHAPLMRDESGQRLAKRYDALALRELRAQGVTAESILEQFERDVPEP